MSWPTVRLKRVCRLQSGLTIDGSRGVTEDSVTLPYLRVANVQAGWLDLGSVTEVTVPKKTAASSTLRPGDVLMTEGGDLDKLGRGTVWSGEIPDCLHQNHVFALRPFKEMLDPRFLAYVTQSSLSRHYFESTGTKTTNLASTSSSKILDLPVPLPSLEEQRRIAAFLDHQTAWLSVVRQVRSAQVALLRERREAEVRAILNLGTSGLFALRRAGVSVTTGPFGTVFSADEYIVGGIPMINPVHIKDGVLEPTDHHTVAPETARLRLRRHQLRAGDIVVGRKGDIGRAALVQPDQDGWICGSDSIALHAAGSRIEPHFLACLLSLSETRAQLLEKSAAATMPSLSEGNLLQLRVPIFDQSTQRRLIGEVDRVDKWTRSCIAAMRRQVTLTDERRQALITAAVTGQIDVTTARGLD